MTPRSTQLPALRFPLRLRSSQNWGLGGLLLLALLAPTLPGGHRRPSPR